MLLLLSMMNQLVCRCCLLENPAHTHNLFDGEGDGSLCAALLACVPSDVHIEPDDGLPEVICDRCCLRVREAFDFRRSCASADRELRRRYEDTNRAIDKALGIDLLDSFESVYVSDATLLETWQSSVASEECGTVEGTAFEEDAQELTEAFENIEMSMLSDLLLEDSSFSSLPDSGYSTGSNEEDAFISELLNEVFAEAGTEPSLLQTGACGNSHSFCMPTAPAATATAALPAQLQPAASSPPPVDSTRLPQYAPTPPPPPPPPPHHQTPPAPASKALHSCPQCEKQFTRNFQLRLHLISVHKLGDGLQYRCEQCQKTFASRHSLNYHQKSLHSSERPFACALCQRRFVLRSQLASHSRIHTGDVKPRVFACTKCDKLWPTRSDLRTHMRSHDPTVERPFKCDRCEKCFFTRGHLSSHILVHTGQKPFACCYCHKSYQSVGNLNNHLVRRHAEALLQKRYQQLQRQPQPQSQLQGIPA